MDNKALTGAILSTVLVAGCATTATTTQMQNLKTESSQVPLGYANSAIESGECVELSQHELQGKVGMTVSHDLQLLASEIDNVVTYNGGNSYIIRSWEWVDVDAWGSTAPLVEIAVMNCGGASRAVSTGGGEHDEASHSLSTGGSVRYECYTYDYPAQHVLTLPVAQLNADVAEVTVMFHGEQLTATYVRNGLTQLWLFEENLYVQIDPDLTGKYMNFQSAEEDERRKPEAVFECEKRR